MFTTSSSYPAGTPSNNRPSHRPSHHANDAGTAFQNPWLSAEKLTWAELELDGAWAGESRCIVGTTLGHAGVITEIPLEGIEDSDGENKSFWIVYDNIFSVRAGPMQYTGPQRLRSPPCQVTDVPGNKSWICSLGVSREMVYELDWWQNRECSVQDFGFTTSQSASEDTLLRFICVPAQHNSGRSALDQGTTLWCGWVIEQLVVSKEEAKPSKIRRKGAIYHAGDTGYRRTANSSSVCPIFKEIGQKFGPLDMSFVPIWRGGSLGFFSLVGLRLSYIDIPSALHVAPADAINIHKDVLSQNTVAIHFGTFVGSKIIAFNKGRQDQGVEELDDTLGGERGRAGILDIGGSLAVEVDVRDVTAAN
ncbi:hypothetical protein O988_00320 [Pseudogymnoascus sp. VKM F-3808]|nr:hypothetical protein O988_00320 [Pseudogymnoascus sp. VKM F-3808]